MLCFYVKAKGLVTGCEKFVYKVHDFMCTTQGYLQKQKCTLNRNEGEKLGF